MSFEKLAEHRRVWKEKGLLRDIYTRWYTNIQHHLPSKGPILEVGGGSGNLKEFCPEIITSDFIFCPWLDLNLDAQKLPIKSNSLEGIVAIDVLHHLADPLAFMEEAQRALVSKGRLILLEPFISLWSMPVYRFLHPEDLDFSYNPFAGKEKKPDKAPFEGNLAIATIIFDKYNRKLEARLPNFPVIKRYHSDFFLYPLSGGFDHPCFCPGFMVPAISFLERLMQPAARLLAYRVLIVMENHT